MVTASASETCTSKVKCGVRRLAWCVRGLAKMGARARQVVCCVSVVGRGWRGGRGEERKDGERERGRPFDHNVGMFCKFLKSLLLKAIKVKQLHEPQNKKKHMTREIDNGRKTRAYHLFEVGGGGEEGRGMKNTCKMRKSEHVCVNFFFVPEDDKHHR